MNEQIKAQNEFEAWASKDFGLRPSHFTKDSEGDYLNYPTQCYFQVWQASREALVIELPNRDGVNMYGADVLEINDVRKSIEAAGLKVKP